MNVPVMISTDDKGEKEGSPLVPCPSCGRRMVYHEKGHRFVCYKCIEADRKAPDEEGDLLGLVLLILFLVGLFLALLVMAFYGVLPSGSIENLTAAKALDNNGSTVTDYRPVLGAIGVFVFFYVLAYLWERGRERCDECGEVLKEVPTGDFYCIHCRAFYNREDVVGEVET